ncbi:unnamed protein product [Fusarium graminearum]|uniref:Chromosome 2, complete genome n=2 Tax=Gibberella zeae TaxID=5518 RepID=I1RK69_GIBZE|nr:hypothetical protein FGSG_04262 [Fusarium graminearum PH-1]EYB24792.1 hypothetical protein FG05_04262 [Fusarium graminearum]ESU08859.1 hypothetical protein FGSG_04262 [Fusarium graminearum PH-1]KAI6773565.1 hypothetical protein HG531_000414 [Fusarium graminearum]PCD28156.1 hypothetical protein FGRA07_03295 [Fusarium graminearum]CAF3513846.1 unnamed protein product [Fusarium graminearum]|eukprot:XP_011321358.1 hypothetical protein FGSG_04262 [Fusarium graminearum PH-1]
MGIPRLISTLEPYVVHGILDNESIVIDGPALAYHVLYICNRHGIPQPSYNVLGETTIAWLDALVERGVNIEAIYFDGYLPPDKEPVRMHRMVKSLSQLKRTHATEIDGYFPAYFSTPDETSPALFSTARPPVGKPTIPPSFHVPAIIDVLRLSPRYAKFVHLVPGEADAYCAQHLLQSGGTVLTSDSDLIVHELGKGSVVFLRDIYRDETSHLACARFSPEHICEKLKLASSAEICRFAYERKSSPHSTLPQLLQDCIKPVADQTGYTEFCREYLDHAIAPIPISAHGTPISIDNLDPRISELVLQLAQNEDQMNEPSEPKIFLPILLENPEKGSAWEQSTPIRQLAYTIARWIIPGPSLAVHEYRRVNTTVQKGRQALMLSEGAARTFAGGLTRLMSTIKTRTRGDTNLAWHVLCLTLDIRYCHEEGKHSHTLHTLETSSQKPLFKRVSWDIIHFTAHIQAAYYSFRLLRQVLSLGQPKKALPELWDMLSTLPSLAECPDINSTIELLQNSSETRIYETIAKSVPLPSVDVGEKPKRTAKNRKSRVVKENSPKTKARVTKSGTRNMFDILSS